MITHGILSSFVMFDWLIHEIKQTDNIRIENQKVNWNQTKVYDNSNPARFKLLDREKFV